MRTHEAISMPFHGSELLKMIFDYKAHFRNWAINNNELDIIPVDPGYALLSSITSMGRYFEIDLKTLHESELFSIGLKVYRYMFDIEDGIIDNQSFRKTMRNKNVSLENFIHQVTHTKVNGLCSNDFFNIELPEALANNENLKNLILKIHNEWLQSEYNNIINPPKDNFIDHAKQRIEKSTVNAAHILAIIFTEHMNNGQDFSEADIIFIQESSRLAAMIDELLDVGIDAHNGETTVPIACAMIVGEWNKLKLFIAANPNFSLSLIGGHRKKFPKTIALWEKIFNESIQKLKRNDHKTAGSLQMLAYLYPFASQIPQLQKILPVTRA